MDIIDLPPELQELAHQRQRDQGNSGTFTGALSRGKAKNNFDWANTPEGDDFWRNIFYNEDVSKHLMYPKKCIIAINYEIY